MKSFLITSSFETERKANIEKLCIQLPGIERIEAIYPAHQKVAFLSQAIALSKQRAGIALLPGEIGCLLSHRKIWHNIVNSKTTEQEHFLVLESDSRINNPALILQYANSLTEKSDILFWGAWDGHLQLFRSSKQKLTEGYVYGEPFIKSIYCTYGYSLNKKAAKLLLERTGKFSYPVDQFKRYFIRDELRIGGIVPELIGTTGIKSVIRKNKPWQLLNTLFLAALDMKNKLICFFK